MNRLSRRAFLGGAATVAAVVVLPVAAAERAAAAATGPSAANATGSRAAARQAVALKRSTYVPLVNATFQMVDGRGNAVAVVLSQVADLSPAVTPNDENRFSLIFDGPKARPRAQGTYHFRNPQSGPVDLFVVPVNRVTSVCNYQAIINAKP